MAISLIRYCKTTKDHLVSVTSPPNFSNICLPFIPGTIRMGTRGTGRRSIQQSRRRRPQMLYCTVMCSSFIPLLRAGSPSPKILTTTLAALFIAKPPAHSHTTPPLPSNFILAAKWETDPHRHPLHIATSSDLARRTPPALFDSNSHMNPRSFRRRSLAYTMTVFHSFMCTYVDVLFLLFLALDLDPRYPFAWNIFLPHSHPFFTYEYLV